MHSHESKVHPAADNPTFVPKNFILAILFTAASTKYEARRSAVRKISITKLIFL